MYDKKNELRMVIIVLSLVIIAVFESIRMAFITGLIVALIAPPIATIIAMVIARKKLHSEIEQA